VKGYFGIWGPNNQLVLVDADLNEEAVEVNKANGINEANGANVANRANLDNKANKASLANEANDAIKSDVANVAKMNGYLSLMDVTISL
jgi:hypothetical protein